MLKWSYSKDASKTSGSDRSGWQLVDSAGGSIYRPGGPSAIAPPLIKGGLERPGAGPCPAIRVRLLSPPPGQLSGPANRKTDSTVPSSRLQPPPRSPTIKNAEFHPSHLDLLTRVSNTQTVFDRASLSPMKPRKKAARYALVVAVLAAISAISWVASRRDEDATTRVGSESPSNAPKPPPSRPDREQVHEGPGSTDEGPEDDVSVEPSEAAVVEQIDSLLAIGLGRVTTSQAQARIKDILAIPGSIPILKRKLTEGSLPEKLLSIYALIEADEFPNDLFEVVFNDSSPYVQAEALHFLFRTRQFDRVDAFLDARLLSLDWNTVTALLDAAGNKAKPDLPVALSRLNLGEGLPLYLDLLAERAPSVRLAAFTLLNEPGVTSNTKSLLLRLTDPTPDQELVQRLRPAFESEADKAARIQIAQQIAARSSRQDQETVAFLASGLGPTPEALPLIDLQFKEDRIERLREHEQMMERVMSSDDFDPVALNGALGAYLREGEMVGIQALSIDTLHAVTAFLREKNFVYAPDIIAQGEYIARQLE